MLHRHVTVRLSFKPRLVGFQKKLFCNGQRRHILFIIIIENRDCCESRPQVTNAVGRQCLKTRLRFCPSPFCCVPSLRSIARLFCAKAVSQFSRGLTGSNRLAQPIKAGPLRAAQAQGLHRLGHIKARQSPDRIGRHINNLFQMYEAFAGRMGWKLEVMNTDHSDMGGYNDITFLVKGDGAWTRLKHEGGPHRVQRVPVTEAQGRIHTSSATVTVLPEVDDVEIDIDQNDLEIQVYRSSGPGGQSVNTTDSAVRITHKPTGVVVAMQDEKSQLQNKAKALRVRKSRLFQLEQERQQAELSSARKDQVGGGGRSEKIRTYNFKENRVTHHDIGLTVYKLDKVLAGELDDISDALVQDEQTKRLEGDEA